MYASYQALASGIPRNRYNSFSHREGLTFEEFEKIEANNDERRELLKRSTLKGLRIVFNWKHTLIAGAISDPQLYINLMLFLLGRVVKANYFPTLHSVIFDAMSILAGLFSFLLVFYLTQSYSRFMAQYDLSMACESRIFDIMLLARACLRHEAAWRLFRHINAAHILGYVGIGNVYNEDNFFHPLNAKYGLLNDSELQRVASIGFKGCVAYRELCAWAVEGIVQENKAKHIDDFKSDDLLTQIFALRAKIDGLYNYADQPLPYSYIHFINFMVFLYLPLFSYGFACSYNVNIGNTLLSMHDTIIGALIVLLNSLVILALRTLAQHLQEPYGEDVEDLAVLHYIRFTIHMSMRILCASSVNDASEEDEAILAKVREKAFAELALSFKEGSNGRRHSTSRLMFEAPDAPVEDDSFVAWDV